MEHFPLVDAGESELVRRSRSGQGPHEVKPSYLRVLDLLLVLLLPVLLLASFYHRRFICASIASLTLIRRDRRRSKKATKEESYDCRNLFLSLYLSIIYTIERILFF